MRIVNRGLMALLGLALAMLGVLAVVEVVAAAMSRPGVLLDRAAADSTLRDLAWDDAAVWGTAAAAVVLGLLLLALQVKPRRIPAYPATSSRGDRDLEYARGGIATFAEWTATADRDVAAASSSLKRRVLRLRLELFADADPASVSKRVGGAVEQRLESLGLTRRPKVKVAAARGERRAR